jgi:hypothetical protein
MKTEKIKLAIIILLLCLCLPFGGCAELKFLISDPSSEQAITTSSEVSSEISDSSNSKTSSAENSSSQASVTASSQITSSRSTTAFVTVTEGMTMADVFKLLEENDVCKADKLWKTANSYDYTYYPLVDAIKSNDHRCFLLEGYLFPDTYESRDPDEHAEPLEPHIPNSSSNNSSDSPSINLKLTFTLPGSLFSG